MLLSITKIDNNTDQGDIDVSNTEPQKVLVSMFWWCKTYFMVSMHFDNWRMHSAFISFHVEIGCIWLRKFRLNLCVVHMIYLGFRFGKNFKWTSFSRPRYIRWRIWKHSFLINYWGAAMHVSVFCAVYKGTTSFFLSPWPPPQTHGEKKELFCYGWPQPNQKYIRLRWGLLWKTRVCPIYLYAWTCLNPLYLWGLKEKHLLVLVGSNGLILDKYEPDLRRVLL